MQKYSDEIVKKYINGEDIEGYSFEELENDKEFMMKVIKISKDKNFYDSCSEKLLNDYEFIKYLILTFKDDLEFVSMVADNYLDTEPKDEDALELQIIMYNLTENDFHLHSMYSHKLARMTKVKDMVFNLKYLDTLKIKSLFLLVTNKYFDNKIIMDYYAEDILDALYEDNYFKLKGLFLRKFKITDNLSKPELVEFIIEMVNTSDIGLAAYLRKNENLLEFYIDDIRSEQLKWQKELKEGHEDIYEEIYNLCLIENKDNFFLGENILYYAFKETGILEEMDERGHVPFVIDNESIDNESIDNETSSFLDALIEAEWEGPSNKVLGITINCNPMPVEEFYNKLNGDKEALDSFNRMKEIINMFLKTKGKSRKRKID